MVLNGSDKTKVHKSIAIVQSNYIPWKGYFDLIASVDEFILYDDAQYTRRDWRNRNLIKTPHGAKWITVPVKVKGKYHQSIREVELDGELWSKKHLQTLTLNYQRAKYFREVASVFEAIYLEEQHRFLSTLNRRFIETICAYLGIRTRLCNSWDYTATGGKTERLIQLCAQAGCTEYVSGPSAKSYLDENAFSEQGIQVSWFDYSGYPEYEQLWGDFTHHVTILDLLFNCGPMSKHYMKHLPT